ncbi:MAG: UxaA family hydrolase [Desulfitobacteriaceae bacterium]|nr:UxaA family hydrolase [Desulfitobacteriaceae bacterium]MDI6877871.1 UxaA family hydrolase [Desulfitobacteriaceae bacterium]MDI6912728.1 UxaA family hydrolase [Desulfitobacteriaceae bacterium]
MSYKAVMMSGRDNVATALEEISAGGTVFVRKGDEQLTVEVKEHIPFGHKFAMETIVAGTKVIKYGQVIGAASQDIEPGRHVHTHNVESLRGRGDKQ